MPEELMRFQMKPVSVTDLVVNNRTQHDAASEMLAVVKDMKKEVARFYKQLKDPINEKRNIILGWEKEDRQRCEADEEVLAGKISAYRDRERRRAEKVAETKRLKAEAEQAAKHAESLAMLENARSTENDELAEAIIAAELVTLEEQGPARAVVTVRRPDFGNSAIGERKTWVPEVADLRALCLAVGKGDLPEGLVQPNWVELRKRAIALGEEMESVTPGCRASQKTSLAGKRR